MIGVLAIFAALCLKIAIYMVAFPELSIGLFFFVGVLFPFDGIPVVDPAQGSAQMAPFEVLYPVVSFLIALASCLEASPDYSYKVLK